MANEHEPGVPDEDDTLGFMDQHSVSRRDLWKALSLGGLAALASSGASSQPAQAQALDDEPIIKLGDPARFVFDYGGDTLVIRDTVSGERFTFDTNTIFSDYSLVWDGLDTPADTELPAGGTTVQQDTNNNRFKFVGINNDATLRRVATLDWTESLTSGDTQLLFETTTHHDNAIAEKGVHHEQPTGTDWAAANIVEKGYPSFDEGGSSLEAYWPLDEDTGATANDVSGTNDGTIDGATLGATGILGTDAMTFDAVDDEIDVGNVDAIEGISALTIVGMMNFDGLTNDSNNNNKALYLFGDGFDNYCSLWHAHGSGGGQNEFIFNVETTTDNNEVRSTNTFSDTDTWYFVAGVYDDSATNNRKLYVGEYGVDTTPNLEGEDNNGPSETPTVTPNHTIGNGRFGGTSDWRMNGQLDEIRVYTRSLSATELNELYRAVV